VNFLIVIVLVVVVVLVGLRAKKSTMGTRRKE
jgi:hypothetical protein